MPFANYIYEYFSGIQTGKYTVGKWVRLIYEIVIAGLERGEYFFNAKKANKAIRFIENFCHHCEGRDDLLKLEVWQKACVSVIFGIVDADGLRVFREVFIVIGRKNGKTLFASAVIAYMAYLDGEYGAKIYCLAPKLEQANIVYDNFFQMIKKEPELSELSKKRRSDIYIEEANTVIKPLAFNAKKSDGFENLKTTAYVGGEEVEPRVVAEVGGGASGLDREEIFVNATDITKVYTDSAQTEITRTDAEYLACLLERGASELEQYAETLSFSSKINTHANLKYREDYDLGDRVTCVNKRWGIKINVRITEVSETYQQNIEEIDITFGESLPALLTQIRQIAK